jgi:hypothetical protein
VPPTARLPRQDQCKETEESHNQEIREQAGRKTNQGKSKVQIIFFYIFLSALMSRGHHFNSGL